MIRSAFSYLSQASNQLFQAGSTDAKSHPLVGQTLTIGDRLYAVRSLLAEGGYALVFAVEEKNGPGQSNTGGSGGAGHWYALKRQLAADRQAADAIVREIKFLKLLSGHPSIVRFCHAAQLGGGGSAEQKRRPPSPSQHHFAEFLVLTELCAGGPLIDVMRRGPFSVEQVCKIFHSTAQAVLHMHDRNPPITHRDIKLEEEMAKYTTPMYRAPEILDTYQNYPIGPAQDIWALGCVLFYLCYRAHPFEDSAKLRILNAKYTLPLADSVYQVFHDLIRRTLQPDPYSRPSIQDLCEQVEDVAMALNVQLEEPVLSADQMLVLLSEQPSMTIPGQRVAAATHSAPPSGSAAPATAATSTSSTTTGNNNASFLMDQGLSLLKTLKEKSSAATMLSDQFKAQLGLHQSPAQSRAESSRAKNGGGGAAKIAPPRPPAPPLFTTRPVQLTFDEENGAAADNDHRLNLNADTKQYKQQQQQRATQTPVDDFFSSLAWEADSGSRSSKDQSHRLHHQRHEQEQNLLSSEPDICFGPTLLDNACDEQQQRVVVDVPAPSAADQLLLLLHDEQQQLSTTIPAGRQRATASVQLTEILTNPGEPLKAETIGAASSLLSDAATTTSSSSTTTTTAATDNASDPKKSQKAGGNFDDILSSVYGFTSSTKLSTRSLADMSKESDNRDMDPLSIQIRDWTSGKERNIRALLGSLNAVLWPEAAQALKQPTVAELYVAENIRKHYLRACLVVHPDKQHPGNLWPKRIPPRWKCSRHKQKCPRLRRICRHETLAGQADARSAQEEMPPASVETHPDLSPPSVGVPSLLLPFANNAATSSSTTTALSASLPRSMSEVFPRRHRRTASANDGQQPANQSPSEDGTASCLGSPCSSSSLPAHFASPATAILLKSDQISAIARFAFTDLVITVLRLDFYRPSDQEAIFCKFALDILLKWGELPAKTQQSLRKRIEVPTARNKQHPGSVH
uniref:non-specific serine/threonine protein kinase n=1 Tax=Globodera rostochiensis TaxID=31243 RepID=A0A914HMF5_GLORO